MFDVVKFTTHLLKQEKLGTPVETGVLSKMEKELYANNVCLLLNNNNFYLVYRIVGS